MPLLGQAAIVVWVEIEPALLVEHDAWHSSEHQSERRLGVPGFLRGRRAAAVDPQASQPRIILYDIAPVVLRCAAARPDRRGALDASRPLIR
jgi:hypothetical protein